MNRKKSFALTVVTTIISVIVSMMITYLLFSILGSDDVVRLKDTIVIAFIAPLIITPIICLFYIRLNNRLQTALDNIQKLQRLIPICANCKKIRDDKGYWNKIERYISDHSATEFTHGICPECTKKLYGDILDHKTDKKTTAL